MKRIPSLYDTFEIFAIFEILPIFEISNANYGQMTIIIANFFFVIFDEKYVLYILVEFESDRVSPRESAKNGRIGADGLNCKIFVKSELISEIYDKNYPRKKNFMSLRQF